jgi:AraC-like DNA-binding protein
MAAIRMTGRALSEVNLRVLWLDSRVVEHWGVRGTSASMPLWRFYFNHNDSAAVRFNGREYSLGPRTALLIAPMTPVEAIQARPMQHTFMNFSLGRPYDQIGPGVWAVPVTPARRRQIESLVSAFRASPSSHWRESLLAHALLCGMLAHIPADEWPSPVADPRVDHAIAYMEQHLARPIANSEIARHVAVSPNTLARLFARDVRLSPQQYLLRLRVDRGAVLLQHTDKSIKAIAADCGFCNRYYFSSIFRRLYGLGPATYRAASHAER